MKVFLPFTVRDIGGTATFVKKFTKSIENSGIVVSYSFSFDFDVLFIVGDCPLSQYLQSLFVAKVFRKKIIQRLDGIYTPSSSVGKLYWLYNFKIKIIHDYFADFVVYQSRYSKEVWETICHKKKTNWTIIYNGVDTKKIPARSLSSTGQLTKLITFAQFRRRDQIEPIVESVKRLDPKAFSLDIYGSYTENLRPLFESLPDNIRFMGKRQNEAMLKLLSTYDIFLFSDQSACPNSVLEAMAAGLPTVAFERGSIPELVESGYNGKIVAIREHSDPFADSYPFTERQYTMFADAVTAATNDIPMLSANSRERAQARYDLPAMIRSYEALLTKNT